MTPHDNGWTRMDPDEPGWTRMNPDKRSNVLFIPWVGFLMSGKSVGRYIYEKGQFRLKSWNGTMKILGNCERTMFCILKLYLSLFHQIPNIHRYSFISDIMCNRAFRFFCILKLGATQVLELRINKKSNFSSSKTFSFLKKNITKYSKCRQKLQK